MLIQNWVQGYELRRQLDGSEPLAFRGSHFCPPFALCRTYFLRAAADILRLLPFRVGPEFVKDNWRRAEITLSSLVSSFRVWALSVCKVFVMSVISMVAI